MDKNTSTWNKTITHKYDDIIHMEYPLPGKDKAKHPPMAISDRAKIFAPFAALKGFDESIEQKQRQAMKKEERTD
jgi:hypothetical protein